MTTLDPDRIYHHIIEAANEWVVADEDSRRLIALEKVVLAEIVNQQVGDSMTQRKYLALASGEYKHHLALMIAAKSKANAARARYDAAKNLSELRRSEESTRRAEMNLR